MVYRAAEKECTSGLKRGAPARALVPWPVFASASGLPYRRARLTFKR